MALAEDRGDLHRGVGFLGLLWTSEGSLIGSGWLFGALTATTYAGPSALIGCGSMIAQETSKVLA